MHRQYEYAPGMRRVSHDYPRYTPYKPRARWGPLKRPSFLCKEDLREIEDMPRSVHLRNLPTDVTEAELKDWCNRAIDSRRQSSLSSSDEPATAVKNAVVHLTLMKGSRQRSIANVTLLDHESRQLLKEGAKSVKLRDDISLLEVRLFMISMI